MREIVCPRCYGNGKNMTLMDKPCDKCTGSGRDGKINPWTKSCVGCGGIGKVFFRKNIKCDICNGGGRIYA